MWDWMSLKMDNRDVAGNSSHLLSSACLNLWGFASPLRALVGPAPTRRPLTSTLGQPEAANSARPRSPKTPDPVAARHPLPGPGLLRAPGSLQRLPPGSMLSEITAFRAPPGSVARNSGNLGVSCALVFVAATVWPVYRFMGKVLSELLSDTSGYTHSWLF